MISEPFYKNYLKSHLMEGSSFASPAGHLENHKALQLAHSQFSTPEETVHHHHYGFASFHHFTGPDSALLVPSPTPPNSTFMLCHFSSKF